MAKSFAAALGLLLLFGLVTPATADEVKWSPVSIPSEGKAGNWVLAGDTDIQQLVMTTGGDLYAHVRGLTYTLYESTDEGCRWSYTGTVKDDIVALAAAPDDADTLYYATVSEVYKSSDGGQNFTPLAGSPGGAGSNNIEITDIAVTTMDGSNIVAAATRDSDSSQFGDVYVLDEDKPFSEWISTGIGNYDVYAVAFSPEFADDRQLVAIATDEKDTFVTTKVGDATWGQTVGDARLDRDNSGAPVAVATSAVIAFPEDYQADTDTDRYVQFVAVDTGDGSGDVYTVTGVESPLPSVATDLNIGAGYDLDNVDVTGLAIEGTCATANLLAGAAGSVEVYFSTDGGDSWTRSDKPPTGQTNTYVVMAPDFARTGQAYAATSGYGSAVSITRDGGITWDQVGLIDTEISSIIDLAVSPGYYQDDTLFMLTWGGQHSLWRSLNGGSNWERIYSAFLDGVDQIERVELSPDYGDDSQTLFITGSSDGHPTIWRSEDGGQNFTDRSTPISIDAWAVVDDEAFFIGGYDGSNGLLYYSRNAGLSYSAPAIVGNQPINSVVLSPDYDRDDTILVGNSNGWVYLSSDNGTWFDPVPADATSPPLTGNVFVAFDVEFATNETVYAASDTADEGIYRFIIGRSTSWEQIDSTLPTDGMVSGLEMANSGTLYATNAKADGGIERCLNPTYTLGPTFETVTRGLDDNTTLIGLWLAGNQLWSMDTTNNRLLSYRDTLTTPVSLVSPADKAPGIGTINSDIISDVRLDWESLAGATDYCWQIDYDTDFSSVPGGFEGDTEASSAHLPPLTPATTYYWRVRATGPVLSPWSDKWSFTTSMGSETVAPELYAPEAGASGIPIWPVFQWSAIASADCYELILASDNSFTNPIVAKLGEQALPTTAWQCETELDYGTTYYWKVRAVSDESLSAWSATYAFTTESPGKTAAAPSPASPSPPAPPPAAHTDMTEWLIYLGVALLVTMVALLATMIILVVRMRRP
jgi:hypothetical protein